MLRNSIRNSISSFKQISGGGFTGLLDEYGGAAAAYSVRRLSSTYSGSLIQVRRSSDNTTQDIGFNANGDLDTAALLSFVGAGDGFVRTWYDQSGNTNDAVQTTTSNQPQIVSSGSVVLENGKAAINFDGTGDMLAFTSVSTIQSLLLVALPTDTNGAYTCNILGHQSSYDYSSGTSGQWLNATFASASVKNGSNYLNGVLTDFTTTTRTANQVLVSMYHDGTATGNQLFQDRHYTNRNWTGTAQELILYASEQSANRTEIEGNINNYYSIY